MPLYNVGIGRYRTISTEQDGLQTTQLASCIGIVGYHQGTKNAILAHVMTERYMLADFTLDASKMRKLKGFMEFAACDHLVYRVIIGNIYFRQEVEPQRQKLERIASEIFCHPIVGIGYSMRFYWEAGQGRVMGNAIDADSDGDGEVIPPEAFN